MSDEDDDLDMEEWFAMTDAQRAAAEAVSIRRYNAWYDSKPVAFHQHRNIRDALARCVKYRVYAAEGFSFMGGQLKRQQVYLLKLRTWRQTGVYPGEA